MSDLSDRLRTEFTADKDYADEYVGGWLSLRLATQIKVLREQRGWTQQQLAEEAGMKQERISALEDVDYNSWTISTLKRLAKALDVALYVSFESFNQIVSYIANTSRLNLQRPARIESMKRAAGLSIVSIRDRRDPIPTGDPLRTDNNSAGSGTAEDRAPASAQAN